MSAAAMAIDARCLHSGVGTYALNLLREIRRLAPSVQLQVLTTASDRNRLRTFADSVTVISAPVYSVREQFEVPRAVEAGKLLHTCHYNAPVVRRGPLLVTIPDVIPLSDAKYHASQKSRWIGATMLRQVAQRADHIFTVSEYSRRKIAEKLHVPPEKVSVAYNGVQSIFRPIDRECARDVCRERLGISKSFVLYVGNKRPHKNVSGLLRAFEMLRRQRRIEHELVIIGCSTQEASQVMREAHTLHIGDSVHVARAVDEDLLVAAYNAADLLVLPSFEEGFGLPVLEALACGTPVACSATASLPEVAGDAAAYFDPNDIASIAATTEAVLGDECRAAEMRAKGLARAQRFSWTQSARTHLAVYERYLGACAGM